jgi:hypothetical protein
MLEVKGGVKVFHLDKNNKVKLLIESQDGDVEVLLSIDSTKSLVKLLEEVIDV